MVLTVIMILLLVIVAGGVVLFFSPVAFRLIFSVAGGHVTGGGELSFLHPAVVSVEKKSPGDTLQLRLFGRLWGKKKAAEPEMRSPVGEKSLFEKSLPAVPVPIPEIEIKETEIGSSEPEVSDNESVAVNEVPVTPVDVQEHTTERPSPPTVQKSVSAPDETSVSTSVPDVVSEEETPRKPPHTETEEKVAPEQKKTDNWFKRLERNRYLYFLRNGKWRSKIIRCLLRSGSTLFRLVRFDRFQVALRAGISDPVVIGTFSGVYQALLYGLPLRRPYVFTYEPVFMRNHFECDGSIRVRTSLVRVLMPIIVMIATFPWLHTIWLIWCVYRRERRYKKEQKVAI